jgi:hypothetical protein
MSRFYLGIFLEILTNSNSDPVDLRGAKKKKLALYSQAMLKTD